jgi:hypothetical protein
MHVWDGIWRKVHYNAVFGWEKKTENTLNAELAETQRKDLSKIRGEKLCKEPGRPEGGPYAFFR